ncbi:Hypothetical protein PBC10988_39770 [Planctomycetales bacterium 10988]|nr:Hypothetical protein PBC10988_39770 [Planctomycetales bacterium 10988]
MTLPAWFCRFFLQKTLIFGVFWGTASIQFAAEPVEILSIPPQPVEELPFSEELTSEPPWKSMVVPPLEEELYNHGGTHLYRPFECHPFEYHESVRNHSHPSCKSNTCDICSDHSSHSKCLRLPEWFKEQQPFTGKVPFLGSGPICLSELHWPGKYGFHWEPRFVGSGSYQLFGLAFEDGDQRTDGIGHQLLVDLDLQLTGTERAHVQFRPLGKENSGGSLYQLNDPEGYNDNSTLIPDRYWIEGELFSLAKGLGMDPFAVRDINGVIGKFPMFLHNGYLLNDDLTGLILSKNNWYAPPLSNLNAQFFYAFDDVDAYQDSSADLVGTHLSADYQGDFIEATYAYVSNQDRGGLDRQYAALSYTKFVGRWTFAGRGMFQWGERQGNGAGQLFVLESNFTQVLTCGCLYQLGVKKTVTYCNGFVATEGWDSISGGNFDRLRSALEVNPLIRLSRQRNPDDTAGVVLGSQLFRHHKDESIIPEFVYESPQGDSVFGLGLRYFRKLSPQCFLELRGVKTFSEETDYRREGAFTGLSYLF